MKLMSFLCSVFSLSCVFTINAADPVTYTPLYSQEKMWVELDFSEYPETDPELKAVLQIKPRHIDTNGDAFALAESVVKEFKDKKATSSISFKGFYAAEYRFCVNVFDGAELIGSMEENFLVPEKPVWLKERVGIEALSDDSVLPPFEPVTANKEGKVNVWNRNYQLGALCLPASLDTAEATILATPVALSITADGREVALPVDKKPVLKKAAKGAAEFQAQTAAGKLAISSNARVEYDGIILYEIMISPEEATEIQKLTLQVPLKNEHAAYLWAGGNSREKHKDTPAIVEEDYSQVLDGTGVLWSRPFREMVWLGDDNRGLLWFCQTEQNWYPQEYAERPSALQVVRNDGITVLEVNFISKAKKLTQPVTYEFGLMATPVRPRPKGWRGWRITTYDPTIYASEHNHNQKGNMLVYWPSPLWQKYNLSPLVKDKELYQATAAKDHAEGRVVLPYLAPICIGAGIYKPPQEEFEERTKGSTKVFTWKGKVNSDAGTWVEKNPVYERYSKEWELHPVKTGKVVRGELVYPAHYVSQASHYTDYAVWAMREHARCGADGIGILDGGSSADMNQLHGSGYYDETGTLRPIYTGLAQRDMNKRLLHMFIQERGEKRKLITGLGLDHTHSRTGNVFCNSFYDAGLKGEELNGGYYLHNPEYRKKIETDKYYYANMMTLDKFRIAYTGEQWGWVPVFFPQLKKSPGVSKEWANSLEGAKDFLVLTLLHDTLVWPIWCNAYEVIKTWEAKDKFGIASDDVEFFAYWQNAEMISSSNANIKVSFYRKPGKIMVIAANLAKEPQDTRIQLSFDKIGSVKEPSKVYDGVSDDLLELKDNLIDLTLPARDYKMIIMEK